MRSLKIALDPGHGGRDPGAINGDLKESHIVLIASHLLALKLKAEGVDVKMTRETDKHIWLTQRSWIANKWDADVFVSIHTNSFTNAKPRGFEVHFYPGSLDGRLVARGIVGAYLSLVGDHRPLMLHGSGLFASDFSVLRKTNMPAVLIELGFISNDEDVKILTSPFYLGLMANAIAEYLISPAVSGMFDL